jgi:hypothetical protein
MRRRFFTPGLIAMAPRWQRADGEVQVVGVVPPDPAAPAHDPPLEPRDEAVFLLTAAAEIEHTLMVQYLYAAYSVRVPADDPNSAQLGQVQKMLTQIAREEMGHLATVQNLLHLLGGPLNFNREHSPYASEIYPFRFKLEPLTLDSLAKYVTAESPLEVPSDLPEDDKALLVQISKDAMRSNDGHDVHHVGPIFARLAHLFQVALADDDFSLDTFGRQAKFQDWGFQPVSPETGEALIIDSFPDTDVEQVRAAAITAVQKIAAQGEGFDTAPAGPTGSESHFERFFDIYKRVRQLSTAGVVITWPVAENPNTTSAPPEEPGLADMVTMVQEAQASKGRISIRERGPGHSCSTYVTGCCWLGCRIFCG